MSGPRGLVDTNVFISARNPGEAGHSHSRRILDRIDAGGLRAVVSEVSIAEIRAGLAPPEARSMWQSFTSHLVTSPNYKVVPVDLTVAELAGELRAGSKLTLPDSIIVATGSLEKVDFILTWDRELGREQDLVSIRRPSEVV